MHVNRRRFLITSAAFGTVGASDLTWLAALSRGAATTTINPDEVVFGPETDRLLRLLRTSAVDQCIPAFVREIKAGLSYRQFLTVLFLAAVENGDPHQVAQVFGAHRISSDVRVEERLLPLFWVLHRLKQEQERGKPALKPYKGTLPGAGEAANVFRQALLKSDREQAESAALTLARDHGARYAMHRLCEFAPRNVGDNLGHPAIALANGIRTMDAMGWQHAEVALRYAARYIAGYKGDKTFAGNLERVQANVARLPAGWAATASNRGATLEIYQVLRAGKAAEACDLVCSQLTSGKSKSGAVWDAISLAAADTLFRFKTGGEVIGGVQVHAVTTTNALRYSFDAVDDAQTKLLNLLQAAGVTADFYVRHVGKEGNLRDINVLELESVGAKATLREAFELLPFKSKGYNQKSPDERAASDQACRIAFQHLQDPVNQLRFAELSRSFLCMKASLDPHDIKFPAAIFEDASFVSPEWRPYLLASSVHALHGSRSEDNAALMKVREALS